MSTGEKLTFGQRAADVLRSSMGSWPFVGGFLAFMGAWVVINTLLLRHTAFDKYPYVFLNLLLSTLAGLQGAILLIAAKRMDQISSEIAAHTLDNTETLRQLVEDNTDLTKDVHVLAQDIKDHINKEKAA